MTRLFKLAAGMGLPSSRYARLEQAHTGDLQKRRYTNGQGDCVRFFLSPGLPLPEPHVARPGVVRGQAYPDLVAVTFFFVPFVAVTFFFFLLPWWLAPSAPP